MHVRFCRRLEVARTMASTHSDTGQTLLHGWVHKMAKMSESEHGADVRGILVLPIIRLLFAYRLCWFRIFLLRCNFSSKPKYAVHQPLHGKNTKIIILLPIIAWNKRRGFRKYKSLLYTTNHNRTTNF